MRIAIALGDPNGIGPEIAIKAAHAAQGKVRPRLVGDAFVIEDTAERLASTRRPSSTSLRSTRRATSPASSIRAPARRPSPTPRRR